MKPLEGKDIATLTNVELITEISRLLSENEELRNLTADLRLQAQTNAMEARGANATINEIYQIISGGKGEPGNWNGAEPVRRYVEAAKGEILRLETELVLSKPVFSRRQIEARVKSLEEALKPFVGAFESRRESYSKRYRSNRELGYANFDEMPDDWAMEKIAFNMGVYRRARTALASTGGEHD
jgi:hypothetical protein